MSPDVLPVSATSSVRRSAVSGRECRWSAPPSTTTAGRSLPCRRRRAATSWIRGVVPVLGQCGMRGAENRGIGPARQVRLGEASIPSPSSGYPSGERYTLLSCGMGAAVSLFGSAASFFIRKVFSGHQNQPPSAAAIAAVMRARTMVS